jgi:hypothetical protein
MSKTQKNHLIFVRYSRPVSESFHKPQLLATDRCSKISTAVYNRLPPGHSLPIPRNL